MIALLPLGLIGVCVGISIGAVVRAGYAFSRAHSVVGLPMTKMLSAIRAPLLAGIAMVAVLFPLEAFVLHAGDRATVPGLLLVAFEALLGLAIYMGILHALVPGTLAELRSLVGRIWKRSRPEGQMSDQRRISPGVSATVRSG